MKDAFKRTKPVKADTVEEACPESLTTDKEDTALRLTSCYNRLWETERWHGRKFERILLVVKVFKKGDLSDCKNWRGVTLLPAISKIFCRMILERIKNGVDKKLRPKRSTTEQTFTRRNILEPAYE